MTDTAGLEQALSTPIWWFPFAIAYLFIGALFVILNGPKTSTGHALLILLLWLPSLLISSVMPPEDMP